jgi:hypothetical protein
MGPVGGDNEYDSITTLCRLTSATTRTVQSRSRISAPIGGQTASFLLRAEAFMRDRAILANRAARGDLSRDLLSQYPELMRVASACVAHGRQPALEDTGLVPRIGELRLHALQFAAVARLALLRAPCRGIELLLESGAGDPLTLDLQQRPFSLLRTDALPLVRRWSAASRVPPGNPAAPAQVHGSGPGRPAARWCAGRAPFQSEPDRPAVTYPSHASSLFLRWLRTPLLHSARRKSQDALRDAACPQIFHLPVAPEACNRKGENTGASPIYRTIDLASVSVISIFVAVSVISN